MRLALWLAAVALGGGIAASAALSEAPAPGQSPVRVSRDQALILAREAYLSGDLALARAIAGRILGQDPRDPAALVLVAATGPALGAAAEGRQAGAAAWRNAGGLPKGFRHEAARFTALAALAEGRPFLAEFWLRRALDTAQSAETRAKSREDLARLRAGRPFDLRASASLTPSSNLNSGSSRSALVVAGDTYVGPISTSGQELSGLRLSLQAEAALRLAPSGAGRSTLSLAAYGRFHQLSPEAQARLDADPMLAGGGRFGGRDLDEAALELRFGQERAVRGLAGPLSWGLAGGAIWQGGQFAGRKLAARGQVPLVAGSPGRGEIGLALEAQRSWDLKGAASDLVGLRLGYRGDLGPGQLRLSLSWSQRTSAADVNGTYRSLGAEIGYGQMLGESLRFEASAFVQARDQADFRLGPIAVTAGRHDRVAGLELGLGFPKASLMGLEPSLRLMRQQSWSNVSRYEGSETALSLGLEARF